MLEARESKTVVDVIQVLKYRCYSSLHADKPVCADHQKMVYGVAHGEIASINCTVRANPDAGLAFTWTFNSSSELNYLPRSRFTQDGDTSQVTAVFVQSTVCTSFTVLCTSNEPVLVRRTNVMATLSK